MKYAFFSETQANEHTEKGNNPGFIVWAPDTGKTFFATQFSPQIHHCTSRTDMVNVGKTADDFVILAHPTGPTPKGKEFEKGKVEGRDSTWLTLAMTTENADMIWELNEYIFENEMHALLVEELQKPLEENELTPSFSKATNQNTQAPLTMQDLFTQPHPSNHTPKR